MSILSEFSDAFLNLFHSHGHSLSGKEKAEIPGTLAHIHNKENYDSEELLRSVFQAIDFSESIRKERGLPRNNPIVGDRLLSKADYAEFASPLAIVRKHVDFGSDKETILAALIYRSLRQPKGENGKSAVTYQKEEPECCKKARKLFGDEVVDIAVKALEIRILVALERHVARKMMSRKSYLEAHQKMSLEIIRNDDERGVKAYKIRFVQRAMQLDSLVREKVRPEEFERIVTLSKTVAIPMAAILGCHALKCDMEDRVFALEQPKEFAFYKKLADRVANEASLSYDPKDNKKEVLLEHIREDILRHIPEEYKDTTKYTIKITARAKTPSSIYKKVIDGGDEDVNLDDIIAARVVILVLNQENGEGGDPREAEKAPTLAIAHAVEQGYELKEGRQKDFISNPKKGNDYMSYHTTAIICGVPVELQFRGHHMHEWAEFGEARHSGYKGVDDNLDAAKHRVTVSASDGLLVTLPLGSTVVDSAARVFKDVGDLFKLSKAIVHRIKIGGVYEKELLPSHELAVGDRVIDYSVNHALMQDVAHREMIIASCTVPETRAQLENIHQKMLPNKWRPMKLPVTTKDKGKKNVP